MITKEQKESWIKALRSGEYKQGKKALCYLDNSDGLPRYCCLGVLAEVLNLEKRMLVSPRWYVYTFKNLEHGSFLANEILNYDKFQCILAGKNDRGDSFEEIADWIEKNIPVED